MLTDEEQRELLSLARESIARGLAERYALPDIPGEASFRRHEAAYRGRLAEAGGAFVTLRRNHDLRGCIGYIESPLPLGQVIEEVAAKAAFEDPRFPPLSPDEFQHIHIEISVLSPLQRISSPGDIQVGVHGLVIELGRNRGLLLPQVAVEYHWDRVQFLEQTARKAGLPRDAWKDPAAEMYMFSAEIVQEAPS